MSTPTAVGVRADGSPGNVASTVVIGRQGYRDPGEAVDAFVREHHAAWLGAHVVHGDHDILRAVVGDGYVDAVQPTNGSRAHEKQRNGGQQQTFAGESHGL